jgi:solute carrier family 25 S-adenosylmethionine transporter 26
LTDILLQIVNKEGVQGLYRGFYATLIRDLPYTIMELGLYESIKNRLKGSMRKTNEVYNRGDEVLAAMIAGGIAAFLTTPFDLVKTKLIVDVSFLPFHFNRI